MHIVFVQYGGDYRKAFTSIKSGSEETYGYQKYSIDVLGSLVQAGHSVSVLCALTSEKYRETLSNGVQAVGAGFSEQVSSQVLLKTLDSLQPDRLVVRVPMPAIFRWAIRQRIPTLAMLADSFENKKIVDKLRNRRFARLLNSPVVEWIANHNVNACLSLQDIGVQAEKIVPWDWPAINTPKDNDIKLYDKRSLQLFYAGKLSTLKGVGDLLDAVHILSQHESPIDIKVNIAGSGDVDAFEAQAHRLGISDRITFMGTISHSQVCQEMEQADVAVVPSRREYPEGFPKTINEALCARTPLIISDHSVFNGIFEEGKNALIFPSGNPEKLAHCIGRIQDAKLYRKLSLSTMETWESLQIPMSWGDLIQLWISPSSPRACELQSYTLLSDRYEGRVSLQRSIGSNR